MSSRIYGWLLAFYPEELRRQYGEEMALVFADELREVDFAGAIRLWHRALSEFFWIALPNCATHPAMRVPAIMAAFSLFSLFARFYLGPILLTPATLVVPLAATYICRGHSLTALHLDGEER